ncbi:MAG TPA: hypothetical protein VFQ77_14490 [Pseudonocardiaceae bacterium]|nr:hypothetical protein [Pseudonocardiaceae bacterium]
MDALDRADETLARAQARRAGIVTPDSATSPMDQASTVQIPRSLVQAADPRTNDPDSTMVIPALADDPRAGTRGGFGPARRHR